MGSHQRQVAPFYIYAYDAIISRELIFSVEKQKETSGESTERSAKKKIGKHNIILDLKVLQN